MDRVRIYREEDDDGPAMWEPLSDSDDDYDDYNENPNDSDSEDGRQPKRTTTNIIVPVLPPAPSNMAKPGDSLCSTCTSLRLTPRQFVILPGDRQSSTEDGRTMELGFLTQIRAKQSRCPLCRLVVRSLGPDLPDYEEGERVRVSLRWTTHLSTRSLSVDYLRESGEGIGLAGRRINLFPEITILANDAPIISKASLPRIIKPAIDFPMVQNWLAMCDSAHGDKCNISPMLGRAIPHPTTEIPSFRVIDVIDNCIALAPAECKYIALSYVWGPIDPKTILRLLLGNVGQLQRPGSLVRQEYFTRIPKTVQESMEIVRRLGLRYLWVDSLCIIQDDDKVGGSKMDAISKMDMVYGAAYLTILIASGKDARAGIPGIYPGTRDQFTQPIEQIAHGFRLAYKQGFQDNIPDEVYYTRGWTFQEQKFGNRKLIFSGGQVLFRCGGVGQWREDIVCEEDFTNNVDSFLSGAQPRGNPDSIGHYEDLIRGYSKLSLGFQMDVYNAFAGMARYMRMQLNTELCHGIPTAFFDWFLIWASFTPQERRVDTVTKLLCTPSWSWAGWHGETWAGIWSWYTKNVDSVRNGLRERTWIIWYQRKANNSEDCVLVSDNGYIPGRTNFYGARPYNRFQDIDCSRTRPTARKLARDAPVYYKDNLVGDPGSGYLQFWTVSVRFRLDEPRPEKLEEDDFGPPLPGTGTVGVPKNTRTRVGIYGRNGRELGVVFVNPDWYRAKVPGMHEFILICEGRDERARGGRFDEEDGWKYKIMLIEWRRDYAVRVGIGSIEKYHLSQALEEPIWKEIILG